MDYSLLEVTEEEKQNGKKTHGRVIQEQISSN